MVLVVVLVVVKGDGRVVVRVMVRVVVKGGG